MADAPPVFDASIITNDARLLNLLNTVDVRIENEGRFKDNFTAAEIGVLTSSTNGRSLVDLSGRWGYDSDNGEHTLFEKQSHRNERLPSQQFTDVIMRVLDKIKHDAGTKLKDGWYGVHASDIVDKVCGIHHHNMLSDHRLDRTNKSTVNSIALWHIFLGDLQNLMDLTVIASQDIVNKTINDDHYVSRPFGFVVAMARIILLIVLNQDQSIRQAREWAESLQVFCKAGSLW